MLQTQTRAFLALLLLVLIWGYSWIIMKQMMLYADPFDFSALRYLGGAVVLFGYLFISGQSLRMPPLLPIVLVGVAQTTAFQGLAQWALINGGAGKVALFCYSMPFWVTLLAWWWLSEKPSAKQWIGVGFAALGLILVIAPWLGLGSKFSILLALAGGLAWAIGTVLTKRAFQKYSLAPINFTAWQMLIGSLVLALIAWLVPGKPLVWRSELWLGLAYSAFLASSLAWVLWSFIVRSLPTSVAGLSSLLVPITAIGLAWILLNEVPSRLDLMGIALIFIGLLVVRPKPVKSKISNKEQAR